MWRKRGLGWHLDFWPEGLQGQSTCDLRWSGLARKVSHVTVTPPSEGSESGVWEGGLQFPSLLSDPRTASRTPFVHLGAVILTFSPRGFLSLYSQQGWKSKVCVPCFLNSHPCPSLVCMKCA